jgi:hypothetical protein
LLPACCRALHLELQYVDAMKHVLLLGGDTDTNAGEHAGKNIK